MGASFPAYVAAALGAAADASVNQPTIPGTLNLLATVAKSTSRLGGFMIQNQSANVITVAFDDGSGGALSVFILDPGAASNRQGGAIDSSSWIHQGRIRVYGTAGSQVAIRVW